jgi:hypothetical protein
MVTFTITNVFSSEFETLQPFWILVAVCPSDDIAIVMAPFIVQLFKREKEAVK